jgi:proteasome lid subunit RPN8/RPN11
MKTDPAPKTNSPEASAAAPRVQFAGEVLQQIRQHARSSMQAEICGILIGEAADGVTRVTARIEGEGASQGGAHVTFTQDTWEHIYKIKDAKYPSESIVGWYHSHPGFGIFLSDYDLFIHENFFTAPHQLAWVFDPHSDEEGCFGWVGKKVEPLLEVGVTRQHHPPAPEQTQEEEASRKGMPAPKPGKDAEKEAAIAETSGSFFTTLAAVIIAFSAGIFLQPYIMALMPFVTGAPAAPSEPLPPNRPTQAPQFVIPGLKPSDVPIPTGDAIAPSTPATPQPTSPPQTPSQEKPPEAPQDSSLEKPAP